ncbi:zinc finger CCCH domain-containing protein 18-like isoform X2 [Cydia pomonella]|uniref:zinc finger CCCH domain-containing protein 18-like isoform X2 n=1 Tax=Cydia pomonella TaxID=82600 RepID=UPI002ADD9194|nr:zinc finger CCCH domain-containing protein 18-like isoform X2 [Cydia pomonella]
MMRLEAPEKPHRYHNLLHDDHANEMLEGEGAGLAARVAELEVRCARQAEELLCLRSTLADALRRLNALEGRAPASSTPQRNGGYTGSSGTPTRELRLRQPSYRETAKRTSSYGSTASSLPQRRGPQHQSTGSLQSDSPASSSSLSPAPSPSPRATPAPHRSQASLYVYLSHVIHPHTSGPSTSPQARCSRTRRPLRRRCRRRHRPRRAPPPRRTGRRLACMCTCLMLYTPTLAAPAPVHRLAAVGLAGLFVLAVAGAIALAARHPRAAQVAG